MKEKRKEGGEKGRGQWMVKAKHRNIGTAWKDNRHISLSLSHRNSDTCHHTYNTSLIKLPLMFQNEFLKFQKHQLKQARLHDWKEQIPTPIWNKNVPSKIWNALMHLTSPPGSQSSLYKYILQMIYCMIQVWLDLQVIVPYCNCFHLKPENSLCIGTLDIPMMAHHSTPAAHSSFLRNKSYIILAGIRTFTAQRREIRKECKGCNEGKINDFLPQSWNTGWYIAQVCDHTKLQISNQQADQHTCNTQQFDLRHMRKITA